MADRTGIEWTDATWNPVTGCDPVSAGCDHCYAATIAHRFAGTQAYPDGFKVTLRPERLDQPLRWRRPRRIFVNSMSDLFHADVPDEYIAQVFAVMALAPRHTFQVLTKRHGRMRSLLCSDGFWQLVADAYTARVGAPVAPLQSKVIPWVWLGVSVENQQWADIRVPALLDTPAAVRFLSCEPLLGPVDLAGYLPRSSWAPWYPVECRHGYDGCPRCDRVLASADAVRWVIVGGESGRGARPMHPQWTRDIRDQCVAAGVPFYFKQHGEYISYARPGRSPWADREPDAWVSLRTGVYGPESLAIGDGGDWQGVWRVGKKSSGRELDGRTWDEYPAVAAP